jgi:hypothetical protein
MRHFAAPEAGNWGTFERIKVAVFESVQALGVLPLFSISGLLFSHSSPKFLRPGKNY